MQLATGSGAMTLGAAQARLLVLLDEATRLLVQEHPCGVVLTGAPQDIAVLGLMSLYRSDPIRSYGGGQDPRFHRAAVRFGSLHQTVSADIPRTAPAQMAALTSLAARDGVTLVTGRLETPWHSPFADPSVQGFLASLGASDGDNPNRILVIRTALAPLIGTDFAPEMFNDAAKAEVSWP